MGEKNLRLKIFIIQNSSNLLKELWGEFFLYWNSDIESGCGRRREINNKSEIVGLNNLKNGVDISYNWGAIFLFALVVE